MTVKTFLQKFLVRPSVRFGLGLAYGASFTGMLSLFPFPSGKTYSMVACPLVMLLAFLIERYTKCNINMAYSLLQIFQGKGSIMQSVLVYSGMYYGASYVTTEFRFAIDNAPEVEQRSMTLFMEKLFLGLNESIYMRLQQGVVIMVLFTGFTHWTARIILYVLSMVWISTLPELNPALTTAWFEGSMKFDGMDLSRYWINMIFMVVCCYVVTTVGLYACKAVAPMLPKKMKMGKKSKMA